MDYKGLIIGVVSIAGLMTTAYMTIAPALRVDSDAHLAVYTDTNELLIANDEVANQARETNTTLPQPIEYTLVEVAEHATIDSCWTAVNGRVYDLTPFIGQHPGGKNNILKICGIDGTKDFERQHGGDTHPEDTLASFLIGDLI